MGAFEELGDPAACPPRRCSLPHEPAPGSRAVLPQWSLPSSEQWVSQQHAYALASPTPCTAASHLLS